MINEKDFRTMKLNAWKKIVVSAEVEEDISDIHVAIKSENRGDDFLYVVTKGGHKYLYGFFCNLKYHTNYEDLKPVEEGKDGFLRNPVMFVKDMDEHAVVSNKLFFELESAFKESRMSTRYDRKCFSKESAQRCFERGMKAFENAFIADSFYDYSDKYGEILYFLKNNGIDTPENIEMLKNAHLSSKINGIDGIAGKKEFEGDRIVVDDITFVMVDGEEREAKSIIYSESDPDEWGYCDRIVPLDQFDLNIRAKYKEEVLKGICDIKNRLDLIEQNLDNYSLSVLNNYRFFLKDLYIEDFEETERYYKEFEDEDE